jgi:hypothetical protein
VDNQPDAERHFALSGLFSGLGDNSIHRARAAGLSSIKDAGGLIPEKKISRSVYQKYLLQSRISISPFGWGELCHRDFEIALAGAALAKPSIEHLQTFPPLFVKHKTKNWLHMKLVTHEIGYT